MAKRVPDLVPPGRTNMYGEHVFRLVALFGSAVLTSYVGKHLTFARNSAGNFTLTLPDTYAEITGLSWMMSDASGAILFPVLVTDAVTTGASGGTIIFETRTEAGTATDPTDGSKLWLTVAVSKDELNTTITV